MNSSTYVRYEVLRTFRNRRFLLFSLGFPLILYVIIASTNRHAKVDNIDFPLYFMAGMASWGAMLATLSSGSRIALERQVGWTRQIRITPLKMSVYFAAKVICGYLMALVTMAVLYVAGAALGVRLGGSNWLVMVGLLLVGLIPFVLLGIMAGHLLTPESLGPAVGGLGALFAVFGGAWGPIASGGAFLGVVKLIPSYWLVQSGKIAYDGGGWPGQAWIVVAIWSIAVGRLAIFVYRRDTARIA